MKLAHRDTHQRNIMYLTEYIILNIKMNNIILF